MTKLLEFIRFKCHARMNVMENRENDCKCYNSFTKKFEHRTQVLE